MGRRELLAAAASALVGATGCGSGGVPTAAATRPAGVPLSTFGASSTAEEVSAGLDLSGRLVLVTGATSGLGLETLRVLALRGAHVIGTGRTLDRAAEACRGVAGRTTPVALDLENWDSVVAAARTIAALGQPVDVLVCNAGIMNPPALRLVNGVEQQFAVNHLGHFLLCHHLLDRLRAARQGRVVVVSSRLYSMAPAPGIDFDNLDGTRGYDPQRAYGQSKLANILFAVELARRMRDTNVTANALHPGVANTSLDRANPAWQRLGARLMAWNRPYVKSVEAAAATQVYLATAPALAAVTGHYFEDCNPVVPAGPHARNQELAARLWATSAELTRRYLNA
jgi:NAD(P)-dependent dehydrogenase (short-subunit alcohol dehydrogenase family)